MSAFFKNLSSSCTSLAATTFFAAMSISFAAVPLAFLVVQGFLAVLAALIAVACFWPDGFLVSALSPLLIFEEVLSSSDWSGSPSAMPPERTCSMTLAILSLAPPLVVILLVGSLVLDMLTMNGGEFEGYGG